MPLKEEQTDLATFTLAKFLFDNRHQAKKADKSRLGEETSACKVRPQRVTGEWKDKAKLQIPKGGGQKTKGSQWKTRPLRKTRGGDADESCENTSHTSPVNQRNGKNHTNSHPSDPRNCGVTTERAGTTQGCQHSSHLSPFQRWQPSMKTGRKQMQREPRQSQPPDLLPLGLPQLTGQPLEIQLNPLSSSLAL